MPTTCDDGHVAQPEDPQRHERLRPRAASQATNTTNRSGADGEDAERAAGGPAGLVAADDAVDREHQGAGHEHRAGDVELGGAGLDVVAGQDRPRGDDDRDADRHVDQEDPVPGEEPGEHAAEQHADGAAAGHHEAEDAHRLGPLRRLGEQAHDQRERDRGHRGAAETLHRAADDEPGRGRRQAAGHGGDGEEHRAAEEDPLVAQQVAEPAAQQQEAAEGQQVGVDDPGQRRLAEAEVVADRRQRDVHDALVEHDHQVAEAQHVERQPAGATAGVRRRLGGGVTRGGHGVLSGVEVVSFTSTNRSRAIRQTRRPSVPHRLQRRWNADA